jgi:hypothetical protein
VGVPAKAVSGFRRDEAQAWGEGGSPFGRDRIDGFVPNALMG